MQEFHNPNYLPSLGYLAERIFFCLYVPVSVYFGRLVSSKCKCEFWKTGGFLMETLLKQTGSTRK